MNSDDKVAVAILAIIAIGLVTVVLGAAYIGYAKDRNRNELIKACIASPKELNCEFK